MIGICEKLAARETRLSRRNDFMVRAVATKQRMQLVSSTRNIEKKRSPTCSSDETYGEVCRTVPKNSMYFDPSALVDYII
jgi:hypothetical protein